MHYLWIKALHIVFMVTWFAGLFYLPRLFIYHVKSEDALSQDRFKIMERRLFVIMTIGAALTTIFGLTLATLNPAVLETSWFSVKSAAVVGLVVYHYRCWLWIQRLRDTGQTADTQWLRWFNEIPTVLLLLIVILAIVKPG
jgi:putative membrane protein